MGLDDTRMICTGKAACSTVRCLLFGKTLLVDKVSEFIRKHAIFIDKYGMIIQVQSENIYLVFKYVISSFNTYTYTKQRCQAWF